MNTHILNQKGFVFILVSILMVTFGIQSISYAQEADPTITASVEAPLTEATLDGGVITLNLNGRSFARSWDIGSAVSVSGIERVTTGEWSSGVRRVSDTVVTVTLTFSGNIDTDATLTFTVGADAIAEYNGNALTATLPVTAVEESLEASTEAPLTEATLHGSTITLTLNGRQFGYWVSNAMSVSGIDGVTFDDFEGVDRVSATEVTIELRFAGNIDTDATLTLTVGADTIAGYDKAFTFHFPVTAVEESLEASTEAPLTEATLHGSTITFTLNGRRFTEWGIKHALSFSGIDGVAVAEYGAVDFVSDTVATVELEFAGDIDEDATLTVTVSPDAIGYNKAFTFQFPVTAVKGESLWASTAAPLTEANLDGSIITLNLTGRRFTDRTWYIRDAVSVSGIDGVTVAEYGAVDRVSDTVANVELEFDGTDFDTDATLTFTVGADVISYNKAFTFQFPVTAIQNSNATVSISPASVISPAVGEQLILTLNIAGGENVAGYQATVLYDDTALSFVDATNADYLPADAFFLANRYYRTDYREVKLTANTLAKAANGDGTLATLTFEGVDFKPSMVTLSQFCLVDTNGKRWEATTGSAEVTIPPEPAKAILGDINSDGAVNIQDLTIVGARLGQSGRNSADINGDGLVNIVDLVLVASAFNEAAAAPALNPQTSELITAANLRQWLSQAHGLHLTDATSQRGIRFLEQLLTVLIPQETRLLPNYPNPFNPETWIPYQLAAPSDVSISIYAADGKLVRTLVLGHLAAGIYQNRSRAAHWDGKNEFGEPLASGLYFYMLTVGDFSATRKMLIRK